MQPGSPDVAKIEGSDHIAESHRQINNFQKEQCFTAGEAIWQCCLEWTIALCAREAYTEDRAR